jgi:hypothetical protein
MSLPAQVRKQSEAIAKHYEDVNTDGDDRDAVDATGVDDSGADQADSGADESQQPDLTEQQGGAPKEEQTFEQRYRTLQGMYNADTARLRGENQQLSQRLSQLEQLVSTLSQTPSAPQGDPDQKFVTQQDVEEYGDSVDLMRRVTREETLAYQREIAELRDTMRKMQASVLPRVEQVAQAQSKNAEQQFWGELGRLVPDWRDVNADPDFHSWLLEVDPMSGMPRQTFLDNAQRSYDAQRVAQFFSTWSRMNGGAAARNTQSASQDQLERQVAPGRSRSGSAPTGSGKAKSYSPQDIAKFYTDVRQGRFKGRDDERARLERDIFAAQREGRIVANG